MEQPLNFFDKTNKAHIRSTLKEALEKTGADKVGIKRSGGNRSKKASTKMTIGVIFRNKQREQTGTREMEIGKKEMLIEFSPGEKAPDFLKARIVCGCEIRQQVLDFTERTFLAVKEEGHFLESHEKGVRELVSRVVERFTPTQNTQQP